MTAAADAAKELDEKKRVIAHLTQTLEHTRECLEIARASLESIVANESTLCESQAASREIALNALKRI